MGVMRRYKDKVEVDSLPFESVVGMAERGGMRDRKRRYGMNFVGHGLGLEKGSSFEDFVVGDTEIPFLRRVNLPLDFKDERSLPTQELWFKEETKDVATYVSDSPGAVEH